MYEKYEDGAYCGGLTFRRSAGHFAFWRCHLQLGRSVVDLIAAAYVFHLNLWLEFYFSPFYEAKIKVEASLLPTREERCPVRYLERPTSPWPMIVIHPAKSVDSGSPY